MTQNEYLDLRARIDETYRADIDALDRVMKLVGSDTHKPQKTYVPSPRPEVIEAVANAAARIGRIFSVFDLFHTFPVGAKGFSKANIYLAILRLKGTGIVREVEPGHGRHGAKFEFVAVEKNGELATADMTNPLGPQDAASDANADERIAAAEVKWAEAMKGTN